MWKKMNSFRRFKITAAGRWLTDTECLWLCLLINNSLAAFFLKPSLLQSHLVSINIAAQKHKNYYSLVVLLKSASSGWKIGFDSSLAIDANAERVEMFRLHRWTQMIIYSCAIRLAIRLSTNTFLDCLFVFSQFTFHRQVVKLWLIARHVSITREHKKGNHEKMSSAWKQVFLRRKLMFVVAFKWCCCVRVASLKGIHAPTHCANIISMKKSFHVSLNLRASKLHFLWIT